MSSAEGHKDKSHKDKSEDVNRTQGVVIRAPDGDGPYGRAQNLRRVEENVAGSKVETVMAGLLHDSQLWIVENGHIFDLSKKLVLEVIGNYAVMQPLTGGIWQKWHQRGNSIVSCHEPNVCLQISENGKGREVVVGTLVTTEPADYQALKIGHR